MTTTLIRRTVAVTIAKGTWMGVLVREGFPEKVILTLLLNNAELFWEMRKTDWNV